MAGLVGEVQAPGVRGGGVEWQRVARRVRVPLGFVTAGVFFAFALPRRRSLLGSMALVVPGIALRAYAAGYVRKNTELTRTGPYAYTRNPLYLGSMLLAFGFAVAAGRAWLGVLLVGLFLSIYWPVILSEETFLRAAFPEFGGYARQVPRLLPRPTPARFAGETTGAGQFSPERYRHHREYNALIGAGALYAALLVRMWVARRRVG